MQYVYKSTSFGGCTKLVTKIKQWIMDSNLETEIDIIQYESKKWTGILLTWVEFNFKTQETAMAYKLKFE